MVRTNPQFPRTHSALLRVHWSRAGQPRESFGIVGEPALAVRDGALAALKDEGQAQGRVLGVQSEIPARGLGELSMCIFTRPLRVTKVDEQSVHTVTRGAGGKLLGKPPQPGEPYGDIDLSGAIQHVNVAVFAIAIETHRTAIAGRARSSQLHEKLVTWPCSPSAGAGIECLLTKMEKAPEHEACCFLLRG